jgi:inhibitor of KinA sporulation pathway (predicted exonuclease)
MVRALSLANLELQGTAHRGVDDAWNAARLLQYLIRGKGIAFVGRYW